MARIKFTKGELKRQRDALMQYKRYLPTLQLKKQQLQLEILQELALLQEKKEQEEKKLSAILAWAGLLAEGEGIFLEEWLKPKEVATHDKNVAGTDVPVFDRAEFSPAEYDLFSAPLWFDSAVEALRGLVSLRREIAVIEKGLSLLRQELRITSQRVNLFEKVKIPDAEEAIRLIKIYIGDQMANAVGRSKIAKRKIEKAVLEEVAV